jgi:hypothetical protein
VNPQSITMYESAQCVFIHVPVAAINRVTDFTVVFLMTGLANAAITPDRDEYNYNSSNF